MNALGVNHPVTNTNTGTMSAVMGRGPIPQILIALVLIVLLYLAYACIEILYAYVNRLAMNRTELMPITYGTEDKTYIIPQNPSLQNSIPISLSDNERTGPEFTYSFFIMVHPSAFRQEEGLLHIFHKGNPNQWPMLGPGVYMASETNTLRVYMNTFKTWNNCVEVDNIPIGKWAHIAIVCRSSQLEVFVNGNLAKRMGFDGYAPYQNYGDFCVFSQRRITIPKTVPSTNGNGYNVYGVMKGMLSRLIYFSYALSWSEINTMMAQGPSSTYAGSKDGMPSPYLEDSWWTGGTGM